MSVDNRKTFRNYSRMVAKFGRVFRVPQLVVFTILLTIYIYIYFLLYQYIYIYYYMYENEFSHFKLNSFFCIEVFTPESGMW